MKSFVALISVVALAAGTHSALANGLIIAPNGTAQIGMNDDGSLDAATPGGALVGIGYNFTGQGGRTGMQDALTPGCLCEGWGVSAGGLGSGQANPNYGGYGLTINASSSGTTNNSAPAGSTSTFTSNTALGPLTVTQTLSLSNQTATGALFKDTVVLTNTGASTLTNVSYGRAMDWDVPPTEFNEFVTLKGTGTTTTLVHSNDNGFQGGDPTNVSPGILVADKTDVTHSGPTDHGSYFSFDFGSVAAGGNYTFNIYYGAGANEADALALLSAVSPELYSLGESNNGGSANTGFPTFAFAFSGVGGSVVVPPVPEPSTWLMMILGFVGLSYLGYRRRSHGTALAA
jgi:hypothetical protein